MIRNAVQHSENVRDSLVVNYKSVALSGWTTRAKLAQTYTAFADKLKGTGAAQKEGYAATTLPQPFVTSGNRRMAARLSSVVRCVYWRETAALSCPTISRAIKSETHAAFSIVTAL